MVTVILISVIFNNQLDLRSATIIIFGYILTLSFANYINNFSRTRYYKISLVDRQLSFNSAKHAIELTLKDIRKVVVSKENNMPGKTIYVIIVTKGLKNNIIISNHKSKKIVFDDLIDILDENAVRIVKHNKKFLSNLITLYYMTISQYKNTENIVLKNIKRYKKTYKKTYRIN